VINQFDILKESIFFHDPLRGGESKYNMANIYNGNL
jgi:hypothetical protein